MGDNLDMVHALGFTDEDIVQCLERKGLLSIELEFTRKCNLRCLYCYADAGEAVENEMTIDEIESVVVQAKNLGAKKVILLGGGEPLIYQGVKGVVAFIESLGLRQVLFTNGTLLTEEMAEFLFRKRVAVVIKRNSLKPDVQDMLAGVHGAFEKIQKGLRHLMHAGYPNHGVMLGVQTVICRQNIGELPALWFWARVNGILPYVEIITRQGRAKQNTHLDVPIREIRTIFEHMERIDHENFGIIWKSRPTIAAFSCKRHLYSCLINAQGGVQPCTGLDMTIGNIREQSLSDILLGSSVIENLRNIYERIEGPCRSCSYNYECYGCRGNAYQITGNYLASDPTCWRLPEGFDEGHADLRQ